MGPNRIGKRAQIPILMLFLVAIVLVIATLFIFSSAEPNFAGSSAPAMRAAVSVQFGYDYVINRAKLIAKEVIADNPMGLTDDEARAEFRRIANETDIGMEEAGNFFKIIRDDDKNNFVFKRVSAGYLLNVTNLFVQSQSQSGKVLRVFFKPAYGENEMRRNYNLCMLFGMDGRYLEVSANKNDYLLYC